MSMSRVVELNMLVERQRAEIERLTADLDACREKLRIAVDDADGTHAKRMELDRFTHAAAERQEGTP